MRAVNKCKQGEDNREQPHFEVYRKALYLLVMNNPSEKGMEWLLTFTQHLQQRGLIQSIVWAMLRRWRAKGWKEKLGCEEMILSVWLYTPKVRRVDLKAIDSMELLKGICKFGFLITPYGFEGRVLEQSKKEFLSAVLMQDLSRDSVTFRAGQKRETKGVGSVIGCHSQLCYHVFSDASLAIPKKGI